MPDEINVSVKAPATALLRARAEPALDRSSRTFERDFPGKSLKTLWFQVFGGVFVYPCK
jgi:hypothetical protein